MVGFMGIEPTGAYRARWGEGPLWWQGGLWYVDIEGRAVIRFDPATGKETVRELGIRVGTVVPRTGGGLLVAGDGGIYFLDEQGGPLVPVANPEPDMPDNRFNDGKCAPDGRFFGGTISLAKRTGEARLYRLDADLRLSVAYGPVTNSNGIVWSADGSTVYYIDTPRREVLAFDYVDGELRRPRVAVDTQAIEGSPDGMAIDADDHLWVAFCHGGCVRRFDPVSGREKARIDFPCVETTACAFGGPDLGDLYVTTGVPKTQAEEHAGRLWVARGLGVRGQAAHPFG